MFQTLRGRTRIISGFGELECFSGFVNLFRFIREPQPGSVIGELNVVGGGTIPLIQTRPTPLGGASLSSVDGQFATLCGRLVSRQGRIVLDVRLVLPQTQPSPGPIPGPDNQLLLLLLLLLLLSGRFGSFGQSQSINLTNVLGQLGAGQSIDVNTIISQLQSQGINL